MTIDELESKIEEFIIGSGNNTSVTQMIQNHRLMVIKYMPAEYLESALNRQQLYASERAGFTWGDAIYVAPIVYPRTTMMYGEVGVVGIFPADSKRFFDAEDPRGIALYQQWIVHDAALYRELTTTIHADRANRLLRNNFRTRFRIDCIYFKPDEGCTDYVDVAKDWWLAITHWDTRGSVGSGYSGAVESLKWCVIGPDAFKQENQGYRAALHRGLTSSHRFVPGHYTTLGTDVLSAYNSSESKVVMCDFH